jgi:uncharacterized metal-binding protein
MKTNETDGCGQKLIFACSGAADVGHLADLAARKLTLNGDGQMFCLAGIGGRVEAILAATRAARRILVIDGCERECAQKTMALAGFSNFEHLQLADLGFQKGRCPVTAERVEIVVQRATELLD